MSYRDIMQQNRKAQHEHTAAFVDRFPFQRCYLLETKHALECHGGILLRELCRCGAKRYTEIGGGMKTSDTMRSEDGSLGFHAGAFFAPRATGPWTEAKTPWRRHEQEPTDAA